MNNKMSVTEKTIQYLKERIVSDETRVGDKIGTEHEICETLSVGRGTVREAFRTLEAQGYLKLKKGCGAYIACKDKNEMEALKSWLLRNRANINEYIETRDILEPAAAGLAADRATDEQIRELNAIHAAFVEHASSENFELLARMDERFHDEVVRMSGNSIMEMIEGTLNDGIITFRLQTFKIEHNINNCIIAHGRILDALKSRDAEIARIYMDRHIRLITEDIEKAID